ncbi:hypothetical protein P3S68_024865 [Capsicum galapagoense]
MASVDPIIYATVAAASTAKLAWDSLHLAYANKSQSSRDYQRIPSQLPITSIKCALSAMSLPLAGATVTSDELVVKILSGLGSDFRDNLKSPQLEEPALKRENNLGDSTYKGLPEHQPVESSNDGLIL